MCRCTCVWISIQHGPVCLAVSCMLCWFCIALLSELCGVSLNAPGRSRPGSQATICRWSQYLCQGRTFPPARLPRVGPLGFTSMVRNGLGCGSVGHKIIITSPQPGPIVNTDKHSHAHKGTQHEEDTSVYTKACAQSTLTVHKLPSLNLFFSVTRCYIGLCSNVSGV